MKLNRNPTQHDTGYAGIVMKDNQNVIFEILIYRTWDAAAFLSSSSSM